jgi:glycosyltransferase involved in cell wall biosynthesis
VKRAALLIHGPLTVVGGVERHNRYLLDFLKEEGFQVDVYEPSVVDVPFFIKRYFYPFVQYYYVGRELGKHTEDYHLVLTTGYTGGFLKGKNVVNISFGSVRSYSNYIRHSYNRKFLFNMYFATLFDRWSKKGKCCIAISPQVETELRKDYGIQSILIPCGIDTKHFVRHESGQEIRSRYGIAPQTLVGVYTGRWDVAHKGLDMLVPLMRERSDVHWIIAPDKSVEVDGINNITVLKDVSYEDLPRVYSAADFSIQLSRYESFGFSFIESLACSVPVISTPVGIASYLYDDPLLSQLLVQQHGYQQWKIIEDVHNKIDNMKDKQYLDRLATRGRARVESEFTLEAWKERMKSVFRTVSKGAA